MSDEQQMKQAIADLAGRVRSMVNEDNLPDDALKQANKGRHAVPNLNLKFRRVLKGHFGKIYALQWSADNRLLVSASQDGKLIIWNAFTTNKSAAIPLRSSWVMTCAYAPSGNYVACGGLDNLCTVFQVPMNGPHTQATRPSAELSAHEGYLSCCRFVDDRRIITSSGDSTCILWDVEAKKPISMMVGHEADVMSVSASQDGNTVVSGSVDANAKLWDIRKRFPLVNTFIGHDSDINSVDYRDDLQIFGTASDDSSCRVFDLRSQRQLQVLHDVDRIITGITSVAFSGSGRFLFAGYDDLELRAWDTINGSVAQTVSAHESRVSCLGVSNDGKALCTGSWDTFLKVWA